MGLQARILTHKETKLKVNAFSLYISKNDNFTTLEYSAFLKKYKEPWNYSLDEFTESEKIVLANWTKAIVECINEQRNLGNNPILIFPPTKPTDFKKDNQVFFLLDRLIHFTSHDNYFNYIELKTLSGEELKKFSTIKEREEFLSLTMQDWTIGRKSNSKSEHSNVDFYIFVDDIIINGLMYAKVLEGYSKILGFNYKDALIYSRGFFIARYWNPNYNLDFMIDGVGLETDQKIFALLDKE